MNIPFNDLRDEKVDSLAAAYAREGFEVLKEPAATQLPFDLGGYRPDLLAVRDGAGLFVEVKGRASRLAIDRFQSLAEEIAHHPGWRFVLVTLDDVDSGILPAVLDALPSWAELAQKFIQARTLITQGDLEPGLLYLGSILEAALRRQAITRNIPVERFPVKMLLNHLYSQGELSIDQHDLYLTCMDMRDRIAHGARETIDPGLLAKFMTSTQEVLAEWAEEGRQPMPLAAG